VGIAGCSTCFLVLELVLSHTGNVERAVAFPGSDAKIAAFTSRPLAGLLAVRHRIREDDHERFAPNAEAVVRGGSAASRLRHGLSPAGRSALLPLTAMLLAVPAPRAVAQAQGGWFPRLQLDNDYYNFWRWHTNRPDEEYTNGVRATLTSHGGSWWGDRFARDVPDCTEARRDARACRATTVTIGQELFTPHLDRAPHLVTGWEQERPYHAWLYATGAALMVSERSRRELSFSLGVTGPPAGGALAQGLAHQIGFSEAPTGWETQIGFEPGVLAAYRYSLLALRGGGGRGAGFDVAPEVAVSIGNVRSHAELGATARVGWRLSHPWSPAAWRERAPLEWWLSAAGRVSYVARDMSLDGTLRRPARRVERVPVVRQYRFGVGIRVKHLTLEYIATTRSREYRSGPGHHAWGSIVAGATVAR